MLLPRLVFSRFDGDWVDRFWFAGAGWICGICALRSEPSLRLLAYAGVVFRRPLAYARGSLRGRCLILFCLRALGGVAKHDVALLVQERFLVSELALKTSLFGFAVALLAAIFGGSFAIELQFAEALFGLQDLAMEARRVAADGVELLQVFVEGSRDAVRVLGFEIAGRVGGVGEAAGTFGEEVVLVGSGAG